jgi:hypothetical protein
MAYAGPVVFEYTEGSHRVAKFCKYDCRALGVLFPYTVSWMGMGAFRHPFRMLIAANTFCGWVKTEEDGD